MRSSKASRGRWNCSSVRGCRFSNSRRGHGTRRYPSSSASIRPGYRLPIDERILADTDTLLVFGLDHLLTEQEASPDEIEAVHQWLTREGKCPGSRPHHDVGISSRPERRAWSTRITAMRWCPRQQRFGKYTRSLMKGLGVPVENQFGLRPAWSRARGRSRRSTPTATSTTGLAQGRDHFNFHKHLPHYAITTDDSRVSGAGAAADRPVQAHTRSRKRATPSSIPSSGCLQAERAAAKSCWPTRRSSARCSAPTTA